MHHHPSVQVIHVRACAAHMILSQVMHPLDARSPQPCIQQVLHCMSGSGLRSIPLLARSAGFTSLEDPALLRRYHNHAVMLRMVIFMAERILSGGVRKLRAKSGRPRGKD